MAVVREREESLGRLVGRAVAAKDADERATEVNRQFQVASRQLLVLGSLGRLGRGEAR